MISLEGEEISPLSEAFPGDDQEETVKNKDSLDKFRYFQGLNLFRKGGGEYHIVSHSHFKEQSSVVEQVFVSRD